MWQYVTQKPLGTQAPGLVCLIWALRKGSVTEMGGGGGLISINTKFNFLREKQIGFISAMSYIP